MLRRLGPPDRQSWRAKASGCCCLFGDDLGHRPVLRERPGPASWHVARGCGLLGDTPCAVRREANDGPTGLGAGRTRMHRLCPCSSLGIPQRVALPAYVKIETQSQYSPIVSAHSLLPRPRRPPQ